jgi:hypothetical protein
MTNPITCVNTASESRYCVEREIGEGGMAVVCLATSQESSAEPHGQ